MSHSIIASKSESSNVEGEDEGEGRTFTDLRVLAKWAGLGDEGKDRSRSDPGYFVTLTRQATKRPRRSTEEVLVEKEAKRKAREVRSIEHAKRVRLDSV